MEHESMSQSYCIVTPSYHKDFEVCRLLVDSIEKHVPPEIPHYLVIPRRDKELFETIKKDRTVFLYQEDFLPRWLKAVPFSNGKWWFSFKGLPVRGWIRQQLIKIGSALKLNEDFLIIMDSDSFFVKDFKLKDLIKNGKAPLYVEPIKTLPPMFKAWNEVSAKILGIPLQPDKNAIYVSICVIWSTKDVKKMLGHIENTHKRPWQETICRHFQFSEYTVLGLYRHLILKDSEANQYLDPTVLTLNHWDDSPLNKEELRKFKKGMKPYHIGAMLSAKSGTDISLIREVFEI